MISPSLLVAVGATVNCSRKHKYSNAPVTYAAFNNITLKKVQSIINPVKYTWTIENQLYGFSSADTQTHLYMYLCLSVCPSTLPTYLWGSTATRRVCSNVPPSTVHDLVDNCSDSHHGGGDLQFCTGTGRLVAGLGHDMWVDTDGYYGWWTMVIQIT